MRVVSLLAAGTEILDALGARDLLVGVSHECDHPPEVLDLPRLTRPRLDPSRPGGEIDRELRRLVAEAVSPYEVDAEALRALQPDLILTQDQCEVCAVSPRDLEEALAQWSRKEEVRVVSLRPHRLEDVWSDFERVGEAVDRVGEARELVETSRRRLAALADRAAGGSAVRSVHLEWMDPPMVGGGWSPQLFEAAGAIPWGPEVGTPTEEVSWEALLDARPEAVVVSPCGYPLDKTLAELEVLTGRPGWEDLPAAREGKVWACDGNALFNRSGPRLVESAELLGELLFPERFPARHAARWARRIAP